MQRLQIIMTVLALVVMLCAPASFAQQRDQPTPPVQRTQPMPSTQSTSVSGTVQEVDARAETITLRTEQGKMMELQVPMAALADLQKGDVVEVKMVGAEATEIRKKGLKK
jgi:hypothetical protein